MSLIDKALNRKAAKDNRWPAQEDRPTRPQRETSPSPSQPPLTPRDAPTALQPWKLRVIRPAVLILVTLAGLGAMWVGVTWVQGKMAIRSRETAQVQRTGLRNRPLPSFTPRPKAPDGVEAVVPMASPVPSPAESLARAKALAEARAALANTVRETRYHQPEARPAKADAATPGTAVLAMRTAPARKPPARPRIKAQPKTPTRVEPRAPTPAKPAPQPARAAAKTAAEKLLPLLSPSSRAKPRAPARPVKAAGLPALAPMAPIKVPASAASGHVTAKPAAAKPAAVPAAPTKAAKPARPKPAPVAPHVLKSLPDFKPLPPIPMPVSHATPAGKTPAPPAKAPSGRVPAPAGPAPKAPPRPAVTHTVELTPPAAARSRQASQVAAAPAAGTGTHAARKPAPLASKAKKPQEGTVSKPAAVPAATAPRPASTKPRPPVVAKAPPAPAAKQAAASDSPQAPAAASQRYHLSAVLRDKGGSVAIVNGLFVRVGQTIQSAKVVWIDASSVVLERDGRRFRLRL